MAILRFSTTRKRRELKIMKVKKIRVRKEKRKKATIRTSLGSGLGQIRKCAYHSYSFLSSVGSPPLFWMQHE